MMNCKQYLCQMWELNMLKKRTEDKIQEMQSQCEKMTTVISGMPTRTSSPDGVTALDGLIDMKLMYEDLVKKIVGVQKDLEKFVDQIPDDRYRMILRHRYIDLHRWELIAVELEYSIQHIFELHGAALEVARSMYKEVPNESL